MRGRTGRTVLNVILALLGTALLIAGFFGGCAKGSGSGGGDDDDATTTTTTPTGVGATGGTGGQAAAGGQIGGSGGHGGHGAAGGSAGAGGSGGSCTSGPCGYGCPVCIIQAWDFDSGCPAGWTSDGDNRDWACGAPSWAVMDDCEGGGNVWATNLHDNANTCQNSYLISPRVDLSSYAGETVMFGFYHSYDFRECAAAYPICNMITNAISYSGGAIDVDPGTGWTRVTPQGGYESGGKTVDCADSGSGGGTPACGGQSCDLDGQANAYTAGGIELQWHQGLVDISAYTTSSFQARFVYGSYANDPFWLNRAGWYIDNVAIFIPGPCP